MSLCELRSRNFPLGNNPSSENEQAKMSIILCWEDGAQERRHETVNIQVVFPGLEATVDLLRGVPGRPVEGSRKVPGGGGHLRAVLPPQSRVVVEYSEVPCVAIISAVAGHGSPEKIESELS